MTRKIAGAVLGLVGALVTGVPLYAHHSGAVLYDLTKQVSMKATITEVVWGNPHVEISFDAADETGKVHTWLLENFSPAVLLNGGWTRKSLKPGDAVTITFNPGRTNHYIGRTVKVAFADGKVLTVNPAATPGR
jgi:hypothetical protein